MMMWKPLLYLGVFISLGWSSTTSSVTPSPSNATNSSTSAAGSNETVNVTTAKNATSPSPTIFNTTLRENEVLSVNVTRFPYRICSMAQGTDIVRFAQNIECTPFNPQTDYQEGIMVVYKRNIVAYTFNVTLYQKILTFQRSYKYVKSSYLLGKTVERHGLPLWEVNFVNIANRCYTSFSRVINGETFVAYHKDNYQNDTMWLFEDDYSNTHNQRFVTVKEAWTTYGSVWMYKETCSMNCVVTVTKGRSKYPYDYFALGNGDVVDISPFYNGSNGKTFRENADHFHLRRNYSRLGEFGTVHTELVRHPLVAFFVRPDVTMSWMVEDENTSVCHFAFWDASNRVIRTENDNTYHFSSKEMTATFVTSKSVADPSKDGYQCIKDEAETKLERIFNTTYNGTYEKDGNVTMHVTNGGLVIFWQGVKQKSIAELERVVNGNSSVVNATSKSSRRRRSTSNGTSPSNSSLPESEKNLLYAQVQFTYDTLKNYINTALGHIVEAWCIDQRRTLEVFAELSKINPTRVLSAIYDRPVAAKFMGDVIGLAQCVNINQTSVKVLRDMHVREGPMTGQCYGRPVVLYTFSNSTHVQYGQLGEHNEIFPGKHRIERCEYPSVKIFIVGGVGYKYVDYYFKGLINLDSIEVVDTMIKLNIDPLENADFRMLELYTKDELRSANVFDLEDIMREFNAYKQRVRFVEKKVADDVPTYLRGLDDFMSGLGEVGKHLGVAIGAVGGVVASFVEGFISFIKNPFGSLTALLFMLAVLGVIFLIYQRQRQTYEKPLQVLFPYTSQGNEAPPSYESLYSDGKTPQAQEKTKDKAKTPKKTAAKYTEDDAREILDALIQYDQQARQKLKKQTVEDVEEAKPTLLDTLRYRKSGYKQLKGYSENV
ncbi:envelope glycoprotein B [Aotine betaherpesvirus 1]|uniref:Envelope glycoprotein B n=1 Tax=Aotine betaherpesvirus 1 TaxID=50290 RepID=G8XUD1_9BETA|nr:envelope glycoprotein B [Aotine betaherpesvirus 1]AEV80761.1 envelope glycoprotein B [Aotine betaherpesvirus 1]